MCCRNEMRAFLTTDDQLVKKVSDVAEIKVTDPVSFIREEIE